MPFLWMIFNFPSEESLKPGRDWNRWCFLQSDTIIGVRRIVEARQGLEAIWPIIANECCSVRRIVEARQGLEDQFLSGAIKAVYVRRIVEARQGLEVHTHLQRTCGRFIVRRIVEARQGLEEKLHNQRCLLYALSEESLKPGRDWKYPSPCTDWWSFAVRRIVEARQGLEVTLLL